MKDQLNSILTIRKIAVITLVGVLILLLSIWVPGSSLGFPQDDDEDTEGMPGYADNIYMEYNWISIKQDSPNELTVDERIGFYNKGTENYTAKLFFWSQPILNEIQQFGEVANNSYSPIVPSLIRDVSGTISCIEKRSPNVPITLFF